MVARTRSTGQTRVLRTMLMSSVAVATLVTLLPVVPAQGEERKFAVWLANPVKSGTSYAALPNRDDVRAQYFDTLDNDIHSYAEYWNEISYGQVTISGKALGWFDIPWSVKPATGGVPYDELQRGGCLSLGTGEEVNENFQMFKVDGEFVPGLMDGVWTPGERFRDVNGNDEYDSLFEPAGPDGSGLFCPGNYVDTNGNNVRDLPEPFEDYLSRWDSGSLRWIPVTDEYVRNNYPGNQTALLSVLQGFDLDGAEITHDDQNRLRKLVLPGSQFKDWTVGLPLTIYSADRAQTGVAAENLEVDLHEADVFEPAGDIKVDPELDPNGNAEWDGGVSVFNPEPFFTDDPNDEDDGCRRREPLSAWFPDPAIPNPDPANPDHFGDLNADCTWDAGDLWCDNDTGGDGVMGVRDADRTERNGQWDPGEPLDYDDDGDGVFDPGDGDIFCANDTNGNGQWDDGEPMDDDADGNGDYDAPEPVWLDQDLDGYFDLWGDVVSSLHDTGADGVFGTGDAGENNGIWDAGELIANDVDSDGVCEPGDTWFPGDANNNCRWDSAEIVADALNGVYTIAEVAPDGSYVIVEEDFPGVAEGPLVVEREIPISDSTDYGPRIRPGASDPADPELRNEFVPGIAAAVFAESDEGAYLIIKNSAAGNNGEYIIVRGSFEETLGRRVTVAAPGFAAYEGAEDKADPNVPGEWSFPASDYDLDGEIDYRDRNCDEEYQGGLPPAMYAGVRTRLLVNAQDLDGDGVFDLGGRTGNGKYDGPDRWREEGNTKMIRMWGVGLSTTRPGWLDDWWLFRYGTAAPAGGFGGIPIVTPFVLEPYNEPDPGDPDPPLETGRPFLSDAGGADADEPTGAIQPDATGYYDGPMEFDDLPSSAYHIGGDGRLGEVTSPYNTAHYGHDRVGAGVFFPDGVIPSGGPWAVGVEGTAANDAGNMLNLELLTRRTDGTSLTQPVGFNPRALAELRSDVLAHPLLADPVSFPGFRDWTLDGLIDQGEVRDAGTENYVADAYCGTRDDGYNSTYPHNRRRLIEDVIAAADSSIDWDEFVLGGGPGSGIGGQISGVVLLPAGIGVGDLLMRPASSLGNYVRIPTEDSPDPYYFSDLAVGLDSAGESGSDEGATFQTGFAAHEYLHTWEGLPDLYDYDVFSGGQVNRPVGAWDIMASGGLVHPTPILKSLMGWVEPVDLKAVLIPNVSQIIFLPPSEFRREDVFFYFRNPVFTNQRFWFWSVANQGFSSNLPGQGMMLMHTDAEDNLEAIPAQQRMETRFMFRIVQADGDQALEAGSSSGDAGAPFPGTSGVTTFNVMTDPNNKWYDDDTDAGSGINILDIEPVTTVTGAVGHNVTFLWTPREVPTLDFIEPPGGEVNGNIYKIRYEVFDLFGGATIEFFVDDDINDGMYDGVSIGGGVTKPPGRLEGTHQTDVTVAPFADGGDFYLYARLYPGTNDDGKEESAVSLVRLSNNNIGDGLLLGANGVDPLSRSDVNLDESKVETWKVVCTDDTGTETWSVEGSVSGLQAAEAMTGTTYTTDGGEVTFTIVAGTVDFAVDDRFVFLTTGMTPYSGRLRIQEGDVVQPPIARITAYPPFGQSALDVELDAFASTDFEGNPLFGALYEWDFGDGTTYGPSGVQNLPHTFEPAGSYNVVLTVTAADGGMDTDTVTVDVGNTAPDAVIVACAVAPCGTAGSIQLGQIISFPSTGEITVYFDGSGSLDTNLDELTYEWNLDDGTLIGPGDPGQFDQVEHTYAVAVGDAITVSLRVTDVVGVSDPLRSVDALTLTFANHDPDIVSASATPQSGNVPLTVDFSASANDVDGDPLTYAWDFGDGTTDDGAQVTHTYNSVGVFIATVTVNDGNGGIATRDVPITVNSPGGGGPGPDPVDPDDVQPTFTITDPDGEDLDEAKDDAGKPITDDDGNPIIVGEAPLEVVFDGTESEYPSGATFQWSFGDGKSEGPGPAATFGKVPHTYILFGQFKAKLTISAGTVLKSYSRTVRVVSDADESGSDDFAVVLRATPLSGPAPLPVRFTAEANEAVVRYEWQFGDGSPVMMGTAFEQSHDYLLVGTYLAQVTATNAAGERVVSSPLPIVVTADARGSAPTARLVATPLVGPAPLQVVFSAADSSDPDNDPLTYVWDFEDDGVADATGPTSTHVYSVTGTYTASVLVTDSTGLFDIASTPQAIVVQSSTFVPPSDDDGGGEPAPAPTPPIVVCPALTPTLMGLTLLGLAGMKFGHRRHRRS